MKKLLTTLLIISMFSCKEQENLSLQNNEILKFDSYLDYKSAKSEVAGLSDEEKISWIKNRINSSYYINSLNSYSKLIDNEFKNEEELLDYVKKHSSHLKINKIEGETFIDLKLDDEPSALFLNRDQIFQIDQTAFKYFENYKVSTDIKNIEYLKDISENEILNLPEDFEVIAKEHSMNLRGLDVSGSCGSRSITLRRTDGKKNRLRVELIGQIDDNKSLDYRDHEVIIRAKPYKKSFGVWINVPRTISFRGSITYEYEAAGQMESYSFSFNEYKSETRKLELPTLLHPGNIYELGYPNFYFTRISNLYGDTPSINPLQYSCTK